MTKHRPIRILGIAPYEGMQTLMQKIADERDDILLDSYVGDLQQGVDLVNSQNKNEYDVIVSRGGTAEMIAESTDIPVIEMGISVYDILRSIKLFENYNQKYAIVGFPGITKNVDLLCELLRFHIDIFTIHKTDEIEDVLITLKDKGYRMILCGMLTSGIAKRLGLNAMLITSGAECISTAFDQAVKLCLSQTNLKLENHLYHEILSGGSENTIVFKENGDIFFTSVYGEQLTLLTQLLTKELSSVFLIHTHKFFKNINGTLYSFVCKSMEMDHERYAAFYFSSTSVPLATSKYGIQYSNFQEAEESFFNSFFSITQSAAEIENTIQNINYSRFPVMLSGETGSGRAQVARRIYSTSNLRNNPLINVDCSLLNDRSWNFLTNHYNSPFNDNNNTIFLKDITVLSADRRQQLLSLILDTSLCQRNRIIFSCNCKMGQTLPPEAMDFVNLLSCVTVHIPPLREHPEEIPTLSSLYLNTLNISTATQVIGLEPEAIDLMQAYSWPYNYAQFKRMLHELVLITTTPYISTEHVRELLEKEKPSVFTPDNTDTAFASSQGVIVLDINKSLADITKDIFLKVLKDCDGNQSAAAKRLGIGRSTLWRYLKE